MNLDQLLHQLEHLPPRAYAAAGLTSVVGPLLLRLLGLTFLAQWVRPLALLVLLGGLYAQQERVRAAVQKALGNR
ncbi:MAG TPA: hypothetical protein VLA19_24365 [Herpetosiphonaceae bacterium]|nr:hypothetical protein [Herpetosiphonaceae bacterium]